jgi:hypothetical protein
VTTSVHLCSNCVLRIVRRLQKRFESDSLRISVNLEDFLVDYDSYILDGSSGCYSANRRIVFDPHGNAYPCSLSAYPGDDTGCGMTRFFDANIHRFSQFSDLWRAVEHCISQLHESSCASCFVADRYLNNYVEKLRKDRDIGLPIEEQLFASVRCQSRQNAR